MRKVANVLTISMVAGMLALTGCSAKRKSSEVVVAPMGVAGMGVNGYYGGGATVSNNASIVNAAATTANTVYFAYDSSEINAHGQSVLSQQAQFLQANPEARVQIAGHTDERGSREYNMALGERRAKSAQAYLTSQGVDISRTEAVSFGEDQPAVQGNSEEAYAKNRRAELSY